MRRGPQVLPGAIANRGPAQPNFRAELRRGEAVHPQLELGGSGLRRRLRAGGKLFFILLQASSVPRGGGFPSFYPCRQGRAVADRACDAAQLAAAVEWKTHWGASEGQKRSASASYPCRQQQTEQPQSRVRLPAAPNEPATVSIAAAHGVDPDSYCLDWRRPLRDAEG